LKVKRTFELISHQHNYAQFLCNVIGTNDRTAKRFAREHSLSFRNRIVYVLESGTVLAKYLNGKRLKGIQS
jgi:hypothetical protein